MKYVILDPVFVNVVIFCDFTFSAMAYYLLLLFYFYAILFYFILLYFIRMCVLLVHIGF